MSDDTPGVIIQEQQNIPLDQIQVAVENVRHTDADKDLAKLQENIAKFGLIQPVVVIKEGTKYKLIVGQRRFLAFKRLKKSRIPALVIKPLTHTLQQIVSFGENIHRKKLPYIDTIKLCNTLYASYNNIDEKERVNKIAKDLGLAPTTVSFYLASKLVPENVQKLVDKGMISRDIAYRLTSAFYPDIEKINAIIKHILRLTREEKERVASYAKKNPTANIKDIIQHALNPPPVVKLTIHIATNLNDRLKEISDQQNESISEIINTAISEYLDNEA